MAIDKINATALLDGGVDSDDIATGAVDLNHLSATGTKDATTFLRGDYTFQVVDTDLSADTTPQLGGNLDLNSSDITGTGNIDISGNATLNDGANAYPLKIESTTTHAGIRLENSDNQNGYINYDSSGNDSIRMFVDDGTGTGTHKALQIEAGQVYTRGPIRMANPGNLASPYTTTGDERDFKNVLLTTTDGSQDNWIYRDQAGGSANWGIYHRQIDSDLTSSSSPRVSANSINFMGNTQTAMSISLATGTMRTKGSWINGYQGAAYDRGWNGAPSITVFQNNSAGATNTGSNGFRIHGASGNWYDWDTNGAPPGGPADFSLDLIIDGTYQSSDERKKTNIEDLTDGLDLINQLRPRTFDVMDSDLNIQEGWTDRYGFIAQEVNTVLPSAVNHAEGREGLHDNGWCDAYTVDYGKINVIAVKAIQELSAKVTTLETQVADLTARLEALENA